MTEKIGESMEHKETRGETWGEMCKKVILKNAKKSGSDGLPVDSILQLLRKALYQHDTPNGGEPDKVDEIVDKDDVSFTLIELKGKGLIDIVDGKVYLKEK